MRKLHANRCRQAVAHCPEAARCHPAVGLFETDELRSPHLMLTDLCRDISFAVLTQLIKTLDGILWHDEVIGFFIGKRVPFAPKIDLLPPLLKRRFIDAEFFRLPRFDDVFQRKCTISYDWNIDADIFVDRRRVDVDVNTL